MIVYPYDEPMPPEEVFRIGYRNTRGGGQSWPGGPSVEVAQERLALRQVEVAARPDPRPSGTPVSWYVERVTFYRRTELVSEVQA